MGLLLSTMKVVRGGEMGRISASAPTDSRFSQTAPARIPEFERWPNQYGAHLFRYALRHVRARDVAEDLVQETFLAAMEDSNSFAGRSTRQTWLVGILKHKIVDYFSRRRREVLDGVESRLFGEADRGIDIPERTTLHRTSLHEQQDDPGLIVERRQLWDLVTRGLEDLPPRLSNALSLHDIHGCTTEEVCNLLHITPGNCYVMLHRARRHLRTHLAAYWFSDCRLGRGESDPAPISSRSDERVFESSCWKR